MKKVIVVLALASLFVSCKKEDSNPIQQTETQEKVTDYYPLETGNYWVYQTYQADTSLIFTADNRVDSVFVEGDTLLGSSIFKKIRSSVWGLSFLRDSGDYFVSELGHKTFSIKPTSEYLVQFYEPLPDSLFYNTAIMKSSDSLCVVPAGEYQAKYVVGTITTTKPSPTWMQKRNYYYGYVKNIGLVFKRIMYSSGPIYIEQRLLRYHLNIKQTTN